MVSTERTKAALTDRQKIEILHNSRKLRKKWSTLNREEKEEILKGMEIGTDEKWVLSLFEDLEV